MKKTNRGVRLSYTRLLKPPPNHGVEKNMSVPATCPTNGMTIATDEGDRNPVQKGMMAINAQVSDIIAQSGSRKDSGRADKPTQRARYIAVAATMPTSHVINATMPDGGSSWGCHGTWLAE